MEKKKKGIGTAVLTAIQAQSKSIDEISMLIGERRYKANLKGATTAEWIDLFWQTIGLIESERINKEIKK